MIIRIIISICLFSICIIITLIRKKELEKTCKEWEKSLKEFEEQLDDLKQQIKLYEK